MKGNLLGRSLGSLLGRSVERLKVRGCWMDWGRVRDWALGNWLGEDRILGRLELRYFRHSSRG